MKNTKKIKYVIDHPKRVKLFNSTPAFRELVRKDAKLGENIETVNHYQYSQILKMFPRLNIQVSEI